MLDREGQEVSGSKGYKYFGAARELPGVRELFDAAPAEQSKKTRYVILFGLFWLDHLFSIHKIHIVDVSKFVKCKLLSSGLS